MNLASKSAQAAIEKAKGKLTLAAISKPKAEKKAETKAEPEKAPAKKAAPKAKAKTTKEKSE